MGPYKAAVKILRGQRQRLVEELAKMDVAIGALGGVRTTGRRKPRFSKAARARIAAAQRKRWRKFKKK